MIDETEDKRIMEYFDHLGEHSDFDEKELEAAVKESHKCTKPGISEKSKKVQRLIDNHDIEALNQIFKRDMSWLFSNNRLWFNHIEGNYFPDL